MKLHEYQSKSIFSRYGIPIPKGRIANNAQEAKRIAEELGGRVVIKSQVLVGGRGKAGGIRLAKSTDEAEDIATIILGMEIKGLPVRKVLVEEGVSISKEIYLGLTNDRNEKCPALISSSAGGMDIEEVAAQSPEKIIKILIDPLLGLRDYQIREMAASIDLPKNHWRQFNEIVSGLWRCFQESDAILAEINPLVITTEHRLLALDAKIDIDDNAMFRHPDLADLRDLDGDNSTELEARKYGVSFIKLNGNIGCLVNGAGLAMATMDIIKIQGGEPANFLDIGGGAGAEKVAASLRIILSEPKVKVVLINVFGGITRCDEVAKGVLSALNEVKTTVPMVIRLVGTNAMEGTKILADAHMITADTLMDASKKAVQLSRSAQ